MATPRTRKPRIPAVLFDQPALDIQINIEKLTWEDMKIIISADGKDMTPQQVLDIHGLFERVVEGGAKAVPVVQTMAVIEAIGKAMETLGNPKNSTSA